MSDDPDARWIDRGFWERGRQGEQIVEKEANVRHAACNHGLHSRGGLAGSFSGFARQFRSDDLGVIEGGDEIAVASQVSGEKSGGATMSRAVVREKNQRVSSGLRGGVAHGGLAPWRVARRNGESVLSCRREVLAEAVRRSGIPDFAGEQAVARFIADLDGADANRKRSAGEWIVGLVGGRGGRGIKLGTCPSHR